MSGALAVTWRSVQRTSQEPPALADVHCGEEQGFSAEGDHMIPDEELLHA